MNPSGLLRSISCVVLILCCHLQAAAQQKGFVSTRGKEVIGPGGRPFIMRGTNLGNWLVPEGFHCSA